MKRIIIGIFLPVFLYSCQSKQEENNPLKHPSLIYQNYTPQPTDIVISRAEYKERLYGFWLGQCIANWTGLVTEMDKIGNIGEIKTGPFYTREDWGKKDEPSIWGQGVPSDLSETIDFVVRKKGEIWGADDDTDIEYIYQHLLYTKQKSILSPEDIRDGWLKHIQKEEENYLWVSNQKAFDLMHEGVLPPETSNPEINEHYDMIDAQLTTEIFGFFAPARTDIAQKLAELPILTTARGEAAQISSFYVNMYALASLVDPQKSQKEKILWMADRAREKMEQKSYVTKMYDFVKEEYLKGTKWEDVRDALYEKYQVNQEDGYHITSKALYCNGCFAAGINYAASLVSLFYGEGDLKETIKIGTLAGWDSDNPTATWGGLIGFMIGKTGVEQAFGKDLSDQFDIHRTRQNFPLDSTDNFNDMSKIGVFIVDRVVQEEMKGGIDLEKDIWYIPAI
ncbi:ADP-ribosylglycohydrolase family protein [Flammeovirga sp. EKP202]|uniref:ADP-ribosylglycohydrolase family protein n=1 Tax=Flammeovirga sp. EKP202 TaxID=2770592 RepID=UPI00165F5832|nr:ADP-ribosylglycohydrolase family protein [Flammeovirga sp. EKP202]MBD0401588.1 ADP-ribosylglycohydrolase family protein [Flammeovirga sp. EKP202]